MNKIIRHPINELGYNFISKPYIPDGENEYYLRNRQNKIDSYRPLKVSEIEILIRNGNTSDDWASIYVSKEFDPALVKNSKFFGLVRIGKLEPYYLEFHNLRMPVGIYNSTIISTDFGDNVCIENANYLSHYIIGNEVMIANVHELATTNYSKFGNGILKEGEKEEVRIRIELRNENGGRSVIPFNGMLSSDAALWSDFPEDHKLLKRLTELTSRVLSEKRGFYGTIGDRCIIKDCGIIKDVKMGSDAYIKGANKLKNLTINSDSERPSQIGEGCELVNGIVEYGCRAFYGVKAVRFIMDSNSQLKYGARLINSYLGSNSTISCCEVLNSLIYPGHEQHHNNSFLTALLVLGQSNIAAGATIGSNHNSRGADGEIIAGRGFWPGLCVSLKHNSKFASYTIIVKGDYPYELNIPIPFCLVTNDISKNELVLKPGYWFRHNMYALARNSWKYGNRDSRRNPVQKIEFDYLAPDTVNEMFEGISLIQKTKPTGNGDRIATGIENSARTCIIKRAEETIHLFKELIAYYGITHLILFMQLHNIFSIRRLKKEMSSAGKRTQWTNWGGQLIPNEKCDFLRENIKSGEIDSWDEVHSTYKKWSDAYQKEKTQHALASLFEIKDVAPNQLTLAMIKSWMDEAMKTREWMTVGIYESRKKDYTNSFRKMVYKSTKQMEAVTGKLSENSFIQQENKASEEFRKTVQKIHKSLSD